MKIDALNYQRLRPLCGYRAQRPQEAGDDPDTPRPGPIKEPPSRLDRQPDPIPIDEPRPPKPKKLQPLPPPVVCWQRSFFG